MIIKSIVFVENILDFQIVSLNIGQKLEYNIGLHNLIKEMLETLIQIILMMITHSL